MRKIITITTLILMVNLVFGQSENPDYKTVTDTFESNYTLKHYTLKLLECEFSDFSKKLY